MVEINMENAKAVIVVNREVYEELWTKLPAHKRFVDHDLAKLGVKNLMFEGWPVVVELPEGYLDIGDLSCNYKESITNRESLQRYLATVRICPFCDGKGISEGANNWLS